MQKTKKDRSNTTHNPVTAMTLSIIPGLGQIYNKRYIKGILILIVFLSLVLTSSSFIAEGYWGIATLGTLQGVDDSRWLLIQGLIAIIFTLFLILVYYLNIKDAYKEAERIKAGKKITSIKEGFLSAWDTSFPYILIGPAFLIIIFVVILPLLFMVTLSFTNFNIYNSPPRNLLDWVGFSNFTNLINVPIWRSTFFNVFGWTISWTFIATTLQIGLGFFLAVIVNDKRIKFKKFVRTILILPWAVPSFVSILVFTAMFNEQFGAINRNILSIFGVSIPWMSDPTSTRIAIILIQIWLGFGFLFALFTGVLQSISDDWYEAADVDGATRLQKFAYITFPHVMYATAPMLIMQYAGNFNNFNIMFLFNRGGPPVRGQTAGSTDILISWVYKLTFETQNYSMAAAISIIIGILVSGVAFVQFRRTRSFRDEGTQ